MEVISMFWIIGALLTLGINRGIIKTGLSDQTLLYIVMIVMLLAVLWPYYLGCAIGSYMRSSVKTGCCKETK